MTDLGGGWTIGGLCSFFGWQVRTVDADRTPVALSGDQPEPRTVDAKLILEIGEGRYLVNDRAGRWYLALGSEADMVCLGAGHPDLDGAIGDT
jgi:hypothetical protein